MVLLKIMLFAEHETVNIFIDRWIMFFDKEKQRKRCMKQERKKKVYERVYALHEQADFLCYINEAYMEEYEGKSFVKLEGLVAAGTGGLEDIFLLFDCEGRQKGQITMEELYLGNNSVKQLEGGDKRVALYPKEQDIPYQAGDILCKLTEKERQ